MINIFGKLHRLYRRTGKSEPINIFDSEEPVLLSRSRLTFLELEIDLLSKLLYKEIKISLPQSTLSDLKWSEISIEDLVKIESSINKKFQLKVSPIVEPLISILRGLLETRKKFYSGNVMPFYVKLKKEHVDSTNQTKEEIIYQLKKDKRTRRHSEYKSIEKHFQSNFRTGTPKNSSKVNENNLEFPIINRILSNQNSFTPRSSHVSSAHRLKYDKFFNIDSNTKTPRNVGTKGNNRNDYTPKKNTREFTNLKNLSNKNRNILAAKALLGLSVNLPTNEQEIRKAYLRAAMRWHPDKSNLGSNDKSHSCFTAIQNAMELLLNNISKEGEV
ncbi:hypothetical protein FG386_001138 [Cryptosporidium ryanae]|uniref:uncharacterized protein n=1 Tax=Cryptosporidium ryanae TaxID=515981 RepID=UPI00351A1C8B|nr:hypothetical protein FG386_001138 [Cryptosporidium ryanae]